MKKIKKCLLFSFITIICLTCSLNVKAETDKIKLGSVIEGNYNVVHKEGTHVLQDRMHWILRQSDNSPVYCVQPFVHINSNATYDVNISDLALVANISEEDWKMIERIAYYGYGYKENGIDHTATKWYPATEMLIWRLANRNIENYFTATIGGREDSTILKEEMEEIVRLAEEHSILPSFTGIPEYLNLNETITISDSKNVIYRYDIQNVNGGTVVKSGNSLNITANSLNGLTFDITNNAALYKEPTKLYYAVNSQNAVHTGNIDPISLHISFNVAMGRVKVLKLDSNNKTCNPLGAGTLIGAKYKLLDSNDNLVEMLTIGEDCTATSSLIPTGNYKIIEETPSTGYLINTTVYNVTVNNNETSTITSYEEAITNRFELYKYYSNSALGYINAEKDAEFQIIDSNNIIIHTIITDENGHASFILPYGTYTLKQISGINGYHTIKPMNIVVSENTLETKVIRLNDEAKTARIKIVKKDIDSNKTIKVEGFKYKIKNLSTNEYVCQTINKVICEYETDENGIIITPLPLEYGTYELEETKAMPNYLLNVDKISFTFDDNTNIIDDNVYGKIIEINAYDKVVVGSIEVFKIGEKPLFKDNKINYEDINLSDVEFELYANEDIYLQDGTKVYNNKEIIFSFKTNNGYYKIENINLGKYCLKEKNNPNNYVLDKSEHCFELKYENDNTPNVAFSIKLKNYLKKGTFELSKIDGLNQKGLKGALFEIYTIDDKLVYSGYTDENGSITVKDLPYGKYKYYESKAPVGYLQNENIYYFEIKEDNESIKETIDNYPIVGTLEFSKIDLSTSKPLPNTKIEIYNSKDELVFSGKTNQDGKIIIKELLYGKYYLLEKEAPEGYILNEEAMHFEIKENGKVIKSIMTNEKIESKLIIHKLDNEEEVLSGVKIGIFDLNNNLLYEGLTNEHGIIDINLEYGKYYYQELETIDGYELNNEKIYFEVINNKAIIETSLINIKVPMTIANDHYYIIQILGILMILSGIGVIAYANKKEQK